MPLHSHLLLLPFQGHLDQLPKVLHLHSLVAEYQGHICPATSSCRSRQASGAMGQAPLGCHAPTREVRGPFQGYLQVRGFTTGRKPPEAFCYLPELQRNKESALPALGEKYS